MCSTIGPMYTISAWLWSKCTQEQMMDWAAIFSSPVVTPLNSFFYNGKHRLCPWRVLFCASANVCMHVCMEGSFSYFSLKFFLWIGKWRLSCSYAPMLAWLHVCFVCCMHVLLIACMCWSNALVAAYMYICSYNWFLGILYGIVSMSCMCVSVMSPWHACVCL